MKRIYPFLICLLFIHQAGHAQWTLAGTAFSGAVRGLFFNNSDTGYAVGAGGVISKTTNGGITWTPQASGVATDLRSVHFVNDTLGYISGLAGVVLKTINGGATWVPANAGISASDTLRTIDFISANRGIVGASAGVIYNTTDGGTTWDPVSLGTTSDIVQLDMLDANLGYAVSAKNTFNNGSVFKTIDGGATWIQVYYSASIGFLGLAVADSDTVYAGGESQTIIKTTDGGGAWVTVHTGVFGKRMRSGFALSGIVAYLADDAGNVFNTEDGGTSWNDTLLTGGLYSIYFPGLVGYAGNFNGKIYKYSFPCALPAAAAAINGLDSVCGGSTEQYSIDPVSDADSYNWSVPADATINSGQGTTQINVTFGLLSGQISVTSVSTLCGEGGNISMSLIANLLPDSATAITGLDSVCSGSTEQYSVDAVSGADSYNWSVPGDAVINSGQGTTQINVTFGALSGQISVTPVSDLCGDGGNTSIAVVVNLLPDSANTITGLDSICSGSTEQYVIDAVSGADSYNWSVPADATINSGQGTTQINVTFGALSGQISVISVSDLCGDGGSISIAVVVNLLADAATAITGVDSVCSGSTQQYSIDAVAGADSYNWSVPADATINSGQGTTQINVTFGALSGQISVTSVSDLCGNGGSISMAVVVNLLPDAATAITGLDSVCSGSTLQYSIDAVADADSYNWSVPVDATINLGQGTTQINVTFGILSGPISVTSVSNLCGDGGNISMAVVVTQLPDAAAAITGLDNVCSGSIEQYFIEAVPGADWYNWSLPDDATINSGQGTTQINLTFGVLSGQVSATSESIACGAGGSISTNIVVNPSPSPTITFLSNILSSSDPAGNQWCFNGSPITGATDSTYTPVLNGIYYTIVTNSYGCTGTSNSIDVIGLGINNPSGSALVIFPNPSADVCMIYFPKISDGKLRILNVSGGVEFSENNLTGETYELNTASLPGGFYLVRFYDRENRLIATSKLIVQNRIR